MSPPEPISRLPRPRPYRNLGLGLGLLLGAMPGLAAASCRIVGEAPAATVKPQASPTPTHVRVDVLRGADEDAALAQQARAAVTAALQASRMLAPTGSGLQAALDLHIDVMPDDAGHPGQTYLLGLIYHGARSAPRSGSYTRRIVGGHGADDCSAAFQRMIRHTVTGFLASVQAVADIGSPVTFSAMSDADGSP